MNIHEGKSAKFVNSSVQKLLMCLIIYEKGKEIEHNTFVHFLLIYVVLCY